MIIICNNNTSNQPKVNFTFHIQNINLTLHREYVLKALFKYSYPFLREKDNFLIWPKTISAHRQFHKHEHFEDESQFLLYLLGFSQEGHL